MRILTICQYYKPERFRIDEICEYLVSQGHELTVITGLPNYNTGRVPEEFKFGKNRDNIVNGVRVIRTFLVARKTGVLRLVLNYLSFMISSSIKVIFLKGDFDVVFSYQLSPITMVLPAVIYKKLHKKKLVIYSLDLWPESVKHIIKNENHPVFKMINSLSKYLYQQADVILTSTSTFNEYYSKVHHISESKLIYLPQHAADIYKGLDLNHNDDHTDFIYLGNIGLINDIKCIIDAVKHLSKELQFTVHIVGDGSDFEKMKKYVIDHGLNEHIIFYGQYPQSEMPRFLKNADACLLTLKSDSLAGETIPGKLQGYMAASKTVLAAVNGPAQEIIKESKCGDYVNASDSLGYSNLLKDYIENKNKYVNCGINGRKYFEEHFTIESFVQKLEDTFDSILERSN